MHCCEGSEARVHLNASHLPRHTSIPSTLALHTRTYLQDIFNLLPNLNAAELSRSFAVESNDCMAALYLASLVRSITALHDLIDNKALRMHHEQLQVCGVGVCGGCVWGWLEGSGEGAGGWGAVSVGSDAAMAAGP